MRHTRKGGLRRIATTGGKGTDRRGIGPRSAVAIASTILASACTTAGPAPEPPPTASSEWAVTHELGSDAAPGLDLVAALDPVAGINLNLATERFVWAPESAGGEHTGGAGHAVLYIDGLRTARVYTPWFHIDGLAAGTHELRAVLVGNDHGAYATGGGVIEDRVTVDVPAPVDPAPSPGAHLAADDLTVSLSVSADTIEGWNVFVETTGFVWAPERASSIHTAGEGHARLFVDGSEVGRMYGPAFHLPLIDAGSHEIRVSLVGNDHAPYTIDGVPVEAETSITVEGSRTEPDVTVSYRLSEGTVEGPTSTEIETGALVRIRLSTEVSDRLRLNGYDLSVPIVDGEAEITFIANVPGIFEIGLEKSAVQLGSIVVG